MKNLVDTSGWLEYFEDGPNATFFAEPLKSISDLIVPTICILEVFKDVLSGSTEDAALQVTALMQQGQTTDLDSDIALKAGQLEKNHGLSVVDSIVLATAQLRGAKLWTQRKSLEKFEAVNFCRRNTG